MAPSSCFYMSIHLLFLYSSSQLISAHNLSPSAKALCPEDEMSALLLFKDRYEIANVSIGPLAHPKTLSWNNSRDCCSWDGIECDENTGHVIVLDLGSSFLYGPIDNNSTLFQLAHLEKLNLSNNHFNYSQIPSRVGELSRLTHLDLSASVYSRQVPSEIFKLTRLVYLDLCCNLHPNTSTNLLEMKAPGLRSLAQNLTSLEELLLGHVNMSSEVPNTLANLSSLRRLNMDACKLHGVFPSAVFNLPKLRHLGVGSNKALTGRLPDFNSTSPLEELRLPVTSFSGELPASIGNLHSLQILNLNSWSLPAMVEILPFSSYLYVSGCQFSGSLPASIGNLPSLTYLDIGGCKFSGSIPASFANLSNLEYLDVNMNPFTAQSISSLSWVWKNKKLTTLILEKINLYGKIPPSIGNLSQLVELSFVHNQLSGAIPSQLMNLTQLTSLYLRINQLSGSIPSWLMNMTGLAVLDLAANKFHGEIPSSISQLQNLQFLVVVENNLSGTVELDNFLKLKQLKVLILSFNRLSCRTSSGNVNLPQLFVLGLAACNLSEFPAFLQNQERMNFLDLSDNNIRGEVPFWVSNGSFNYLEYLNLSHNFLTGLHQYYPIFPLSMHRLDLSHNMLKGPPPEAPPYVMYYIVSNNSLTGALPPWICNLRTAITLDLSSNDLTGELPVCLGNIGKSLMILNLKGNHFNGSIPELLVRGMQLTMLDLSGNQLQGKLPRSLANCTMLEFINFANNFIVDTFPSWLGSLPELHVLILRSNKFHGDIERSQSSPMFLKLRILDLSINAFVGKLPVEFFQSWNASKSEMGNFTYMQRNLRPTSYLVFTDYGSYDFSMTVIYKGLELYYPKISEVFQVIDLSSNFFEGEIPSAIGDLKGMQGLNLSNNFLSGHIPSSLGNLTALESLDLSRNKLSGQIPEKLTELGFLSFLNVSYNNLTGSVPRGKQFDTFSNDSFEGNSGLCGEFIYRKCQDSWDKSGQPSTHPEEDRGSPIELDWKIVFMGYGSGLVIGVVIGNAFISWKHVWFEGNARRRRRPSQRQHRLGRNSWSSKFFNLCRD
ncbi:receptor-like protein 7 [Rhodamnia argentea]|uniref:Receptor-like protein 7 n=1 Tax=Rhodamnia argentea TaxID=178133 RepID=A0A8B8N8P2_9MYRT|nr:receptor-like protein 7 [Rhodamnia argentea]